MRAFSVAALLGATLALAAILSFAAPAAATPFAFGDITSYDQNIWGADPLDGPPASILQAKFFTVYPGGVLDVGITGGSGFYMEFTDPESVLSFLPVAGAPKALNATISNPSGYSTGVFSGQVVALALNVDFSDAGLLPTALGVKFGDLLFYNLTGTFAALDGTSVRDLLGITEIALGAGSTPYSITDLSDLLTLVNASFQGGFPSTFADSYLEVAPAPGGGPASVDEPSSLALMLSSLLLVPLFRRRARRIRFHS